MRHLIALGICVSFFLYGCASGSIKTSSQDELDFVSLVKLHPNMTPEEVQGLMGNPTRPILIYFYLIEGSGSFFGRFSKDNYTPLVFVDNKLAGWGWQYLHGAAKGMIND